MRLRIPTNTDDLTLDPAELLPRDALHQQVMKFWEEQGIPATEGGVGLGWWERGAFVPNEQVWGLHEAARTKFASARGAGLIDIFYWPYPPKVSHE